MHDLDRTTLEMEYETNGFDDGEFEFDDGEFEFDDGEFEFDDGEFETFDEAFADSEFEFEYELEGSFDENEEMELAIELLDVKDEAELDQFIGKLIKRTSRFVRRNVPSSIRRRIGRSLRGLARRALPIAGGALGNLIVPGAGGLIGSKLAASAGRAFGLELEGLSPEDQEFEIARRFIRLAGEATKQAATAPSSASPQAVANKAMAIAVRKHAPGLTSRKAAGQSKTRSRSTARQGVWRRRGRSIVLMGVYR